MVRLLTCDLVQTGPERKYVELVRKYISMRHFIDLVAGPPVTEASRSGYTSALNEAVSVDSPSFQSWFSGSKVVDAAGNPLPVYHGTARPDRVGTRFRKARATAGPMAYFTDDAALASNYATNKSDTSLEDDIQFADWFKVKPPGSRVEVNIVHLWSYLSSQQRQTIASLAPRVTQEEDDIFLDGPECDNGIGNYRDQLAATRGNCLAALVESWLASGTIYDEEERFMTVLRLAGVDLPVRYDHPAASYPFVYAVYLSIRQPLVTSSIPQNALDAISKAAVGRRTKPGEFDQWDKRGVDAKAWLRGLLDEVENGRNGSWTVIPDWVTDALAKLGYDGIRDVGGKMSGVESAVWIPFHEHQVKSAVSNRGKFDAGRNGIHEHRTSRAKRP